MKLEILLQPKQEELGQLFYATGPRVATIIGGGGARAGGKSGGLRRIMLDRRLQLPGTPGAIVRRVWKDLQVNHVDKYWLEFPQLKRFWDAEKKRIALPNGSWIDFVYAETQTEVDRKMWGPEWYDIFVDQAEQFNEYELQIIKTANRFGGAALNDCKLGLYFNPGGIGTEYLRRIFSPKHRKFKGNEKPENFAFVHLFGWDNYVWFQELMGPDEFYALSSERRFEIFISQTSEGRKMDQLPPSLRAGHLLGNFDSFAGQYFAGVWDESRLILTAQQQERLLQPWWTRWLAQDPGVVHHASTGWFASGKVAPERFKEVFGVEIAQAETVVVLYRTYSVSDTEETELVRQLAARTAEGEKLTRFFLGQDAWEEDSRGHSQAARIAEEGRRHGFPIPERPDNNRIGGWRFLYAMMKKTCDVMEGKCRPSREDEDYEAEAGGYSVSTPLLLIGPECGDVIDAVPMAVRDTTHPGRAEDVLKQPTKADDDLDMLRYGTKSMLNARKTPAAVEAQELWDETGQAGWSTQGRVMAQKRLEAQVQQTQRRRSRWSR